MKRFLSAILAGILLPVVCYGVTIDPKFSIDPASPAINGNITSDDVLRAGPTVLTQGRDLGLQDDFFSGFYDNLDALSYGKDPIVRPVYFSVDRVAVGLPGSAVYEYAQPGVESAHGNIYQSLPPSGSNVLFRDGTSLGLTPGFFGDDLNALELDTPPSFPVYFSIDFLSASNGFGSGHLAADILMSMGNGSFDIFRDHTTMGLLAEDDIDALVLDVAHNIALFSLSTFSPTTFTGSGNPYNPLGGSGFVSPADIFYTEFDGTFKPWASAAELGLRPDDELNALDTVVPEPGTFVLVTGGGIILLGWAKRKNRNWKS
ncbi:MAG TPA: hypothetical protein VJ508_13925 [Saprospiraceae bacterium]|nr:hypothetical protein [Saprospiraceae bacterium]